MLNDEDYSAFFKLVQTWRYNFPTLKVLFDASIGTVQTRKDLEKSLETLFLQAAEKSPHPLMSLDHDAYHRTVTAHPPAAVIRPG